MEEEVADAGGFEGVSDAVERVAFADRAEVQLQAGLQESHGVRRLVELQMPAADGRERGGDFFGGGHLALAAIEAPDFAELTGGDVECATCRFRKGDRPLEQMEEPFLDFDRLPASSVLHWFRADRPGQARGIPDITPALPLFAQLRRFTLAVIAAAETAADFAGILYTDAPASGEADAAEPFEPIELEKRALVTMPGGWKMAQLQAEQPATTYAEFKKEDHPRSTYFARWME